MATAEIVRGDVAHFQHALGRNARHQVSGQRQLHTAFVGPGDVVASVDQREGRTAVLNGAVPQEGHDQRREDPAGRLEEELGEAEALDEPADAAHPPHPARPGGLRRARVHRVAHVRHNRKQGCGEAAYISRKMLARAFRKRNASAAVRSGKIARARTHARTDRSRWS